MPSRGLGFRALVLTAPAALALCAAVRSDAGVTHRYSFNDGTANDSVGTAHGTLQGRATVASNQLQMNNPAFPPASDPLNGYLSMPPSILPGSGSVTIEQWFTFGGSGFFTEAYTFTDHNDTGAGPTNPPGASNGQYLMHAISAPQNAGSPNPAASGSHVAQALAGFTTETDAFGSTSGLGFAGGGYLDDGVTYMCATVIDGTAGTLSYYVFRVSDGLGGLQHTITAVPLSSYTFTNAYLGRSAFPADNYTNGSVDEFRIFDEARSAADIAADFAAGPDVIVPEPSALGSIALVAAGALGARRSRRRRA
jgi:hypothetical protein